MLLWDGAAEGGTRGGYWTNARKAFEGAAIGRFQPGNHKFEAFYLDKDDLPEADSSTKLWGVNYEYLIGEDTTLGATYLKLSANDTAPQRDGLSVYDFRVFTAPFDSMKGLSFEAEYALEDNGNALDSTAYNVLAAYQLDNDRWKPKFSYRYAIFEGETRRRRERKFRRVVDRVLRLGHLVAGRDRRRVFRLELEPDLAPAARAHEAERLHRDGAHLVRLHAGPSRVARRA